MTNANSDISMMSEPVTMMPPTLSFEVQPPRHPEKAPKFWQSTAQLLSFQPDFMTVTYGAGGHERQASVEVVAKLAADSSVPTCAHITAVGANRAALVAEITRFLAAGTQRFLALRGDPPAGNVEWEPEPGEIGSAIELIKLLRLVDEQQRSRTESRSNFQQPKHRPLVIGVATFPTGNKRAGTTSKQELQRLMAKQQAGANFAITQMLFEADGYLDFLAQAQTAGVTIPIIAGIAPVVSLGLLDKTAVISGCKPPTHLVAQLTSSPNAKDRYEIGMQFTADLAQRVLAGGAPGLHLFTFNRAAPVAELTTTLRWRNWLPATGVKTAR